MSPTTHLLLLPPDRASVLLVCPRKETLGKRTTSSTQDSLSYHPIAAKVPYRPLPLYSSSFPFPPSPPPPPPLHSHFAFREQQKPRGVAHLLRSARKGKRLTGER
eukprot:762800-Hanusia_phi.AAC.3